MADVIAMLICDSHLGLDKAGVIALQFYIGRCYCLVADGIATCLFGIG